MKNFSKQSYVKHNYKLQYRLINDVAKKDLIGRKLTQQVPWKEN